MTTKIYHFHIPKCAGTSLNEWLDDCVSFEKARPPQWHGPVLTWLKGRGIAPRRAWTPVIRMSWDLFDVIHGHNNFLPERPQGSVTLTVLRDPISRSKSLFLDLATLKESDFAHKPPSLISFHRDCLAMPIAEIGRKWTGHPAIEVFLS